MRNHNHLLGRVEGVDGIKTGYTNASGFNLVTSVKRGYRHIVAVVLGGRSAGSRDARMKDLINETIADASTKPSMTLAAETPSLPASPAAVAKQESKPTVTEAESAPVAFAPTLPSPAADATATIPGASDTPIKPVKVKTFAVRLVPSKTAAQPALPAPSSAEMAPPDPATTKSVRTASLGPQPQSEAPTPASAPSKATDIVVPSRPATTRGGWAIQVGAYEDEGEAKGKLTTAKGRVSTLFSKAEAYIERTIKGAKTYYRARFAGFDRDQAQATCKRLKSNDIECMALKL
jgi:D-alanyl-D-alanine carboxypeptidase